MATRRSRTTRRATKTSKRARPKAKPTDVARTLERRLKRVVAERAAESERHARQLLAVRRAADRRLTVMMNEIAALRHHEARAGALERLLAQREAQLSALLAARAAPAAAETTA
jgi:hypothetical protein